MSIPQDTYAKILIAGLHPHLLEKPIIWFEKNTAHILHARHLNPFWHGNTLVAEAGSKKSVSEFLRALDDLGYVKTLGDLHPGEFMHAGGEITVFPINMRAPVRIEFLGNILEDIRNATIAHTVRVARDTPPEFLKRYGLATLRPGDFVVHIDHGIGIFRGVETRDSMRYFLLEYAKPHGKDAPPDTLLVPENAADRLSLYIGFRTPTVHRLGTSVWASVKNKAREDVVKFAKELLALYATRETQNKNPFTETPTLEDELASSFVFDETPDQHAALADIFADMASPKVMDRLLLADVGFGKTEVALRAAFRAVLNNKQVVIICPTTILAEQHMETFKKRLSPFPVTIERLSRLESVSKQKDILGRLSAGAVDIVIGTHRLLSRDVVFKNLGLLIIDEEQRFGVKQKEHIKNIRAGVDVLSLSATPIPRTLYFTLAGLKPMSVIATAPAGRIAPRTFILPFSNATMKRAIAAELERKGQVYVLSNRIHALPQAEALIHRVAPRARVRTIHGRMNEQDILRAMHDFREHKADVLLATTIIENGLDISNANTLIVENASRIGLAQAHQLRGRIGRGEVQSYAYFLYPAHHLGEKASRRLDALFDTQYLGAGQDIAMRDLDIRGAGNILGRDQSGRVNQIGLNLYCHMLAEAVEELREKR